MDIIKVQVALGGMARDVLIYNEDRSVFLQLPEESSAEIIDIVEYHSDPQTLKIYTIGSVDPVSNNLVMDVSVMYEDFGGEIIWYDKSVYNNQAEAEAKRAT